MSIANRSRESTICCLLALAATPAAMAAPAHYVIDPVHTRIVFRVWHLGLSQSIGTFSGATGTLDFDPGDWAGAKLAVDIPLDRLDMGNQAWKDKVLSSDFLAIAKQPVAHFSATRVDAVDKAHAKVTGTLSLRGKDTTIVLDVTLNATVRSMYTLFHKAVGFSATATVHRADLGMTAYPDAVGGDVMLAIEAEAEVHGRAGEQAPATATAAAPLPSSAPSQASPSSSPPQDPHR